MLVMKVELFNSPGMEIDREKLLAIIENGRKVRGWSLRRVATEAGIKYGSLQDLIRGKAQVLRGDKLLKVLKVLNIPIERKTKVVGEVGAGANVFPFDDHANGAALEEVERPLGADLPDDIVAVRIKGDSMEPQFEAGWLLFYSRDQDGVPPDCINEICVVKLLDDSMMVKKVKPGSKPGLYHLFSKNPAHEPLINQKLQWAAKVLSVRPR